jgi:hypothetical protein
VFVVGGLATSELFYLQNLEKDGVLSQVVLGSTGVFTPKQFSKAYARKN